jgi:hypothetical protein
MIRFVDIASDEKPKKGGAAVEVKAAPAPDVAGSAAKPAKRAKKPPGASQSAKS